MSLILSLVDQSTGPTSDTFNISWQHLLIINNRNVNNSERVVDFKLQYTTVQGNDWPQTNFQEVILNSRTYSNKNYNFSLETNAVVRIRLYLRTTRNIYVSNIITIDTRTKPSPPTNVRAVASGNNITVSWTNPTSTGGAPLTGTYVEYSYDGGSFWRSKLVSIFSGVGPVPPGGSYTFANLTRNNTYIFRTRAINQISRTSLSSSRTAPIYLPPNSGTDSFLFDKTTFNNIPNDPSRPSGYWRDLLIFAAEEWEKHIKLDPQVVDYLLRAIPNYRGISLASFQFFSQPASNEQVTLGTAGPTRFHPQSNGDPFSTQIYVDTFGMTINIHPDAAFLTESQDKGTMVHELGHALGFGYGWNRDVVALYGKHPSIAGVGEAGNRWQLRGTFRGPAFVNAQQAYNEMFSPNTNGGPFFRNRMPLMWNAGDYINRIAHWANSRNPVTRDTQLHPPIPSDIMSYGSFVGVNQTQITPVTVGVMLDLGYVPATDDLDPYQGSKKSRSLAGLQVASYKSQVLSGSETGYSTVFSVPSGINPNHLPSTPEPMTLSPIEIIFDNNKPVGVIEHLE